MSFLGSLFGNNNANNAATAYTQNALNGLNAFNGAANVGSTDLISNYSSALQPFLQNFNTAQSGVTQLGNLLGLNGASGNQSALSTLQNTPGYQFQLQQGNNAINAAAAANGTLNSGNQLTALSNYNQGLANTTYNNYVSQLQPYLNQANTAASGIGNVYTGLGSGLNSNQLAQGNAALGVDTGIGQAWANAENAAGNGASNLFGGIGSLLGLGSNTVGGGLLNGIGSGLSSLGSGIMGFLGSDERLKENISEVGELHDGQKVYSYNYIGDPTSRIGLMAQEVLDRYPDAVGDIGGGFLGVNYGKATQYASELGAFLDGPANDDRQADDGYASKLSKFLEAA
jgi:hypothetical protein